MRKTGTKYISIDDVIRKWCTKAICIEFADGTDVLAQENGYTLQQCIGMKGVRFFID